jgi:AbrB family looped-hinge helix DNA binding protein
MVWYNFKVTRKGQVTIPIEIRRELGLENGGRVDIKQEGKVVTLEPAQSVADRTAGIGAAYRLPKPLTPREERDLFEQGVAEEIVREMEEE